MNAQADRPRVIQKQKKFFFFKDLAIFGAGPVIASVLGQCLVIVAMPLIKAGESVIAIQGDSKIRW